MRQGIFILQSFLKCNLFTLFYISNYLNLISAWNKSLQQRLLLYYAKH